MAQERASTHAEDEYENERENDQPSDADENASASGSEGSVGEMMLLSKKPAKKSNLDSEGMYQVH